MSSTWLYVASYVFEAVGLLLIVGGSVAMAYWEPDDDDDWDDEELLARSVIAGSLGPETDIAERTKREDDPAIA